MLALPWERAVLVEDALRTFPADEIMLVSKPSAADERERESDCLRQRES
jgi:hypothetical protein